MIGVTISHYRIIELLGEGGMGKVYLAEHITLGRNVAIKFLSSTTPEYRARFLREARALSGLAHRNIAAVFDYGETDEGTPFIVMELVKGKTLHDKLQEGPLHLAESVKIVSQIGEALAEAHKQGVVHRDIKPSNVVIDERGVVKVLDFGLVKQIQDEYPIDELESQKTLPGTRTRSDVIVGTPLYLSPEQATGKRVDGRSDLFALGAVLYECITGHSAFTGTSVIEIGAQVIHVTPQSPSKLNPDIPPELDRITMKALQKKAEARYQTAGAFIEDLYALLPRLESQSSHSRGPSTKTLISPRTHSVSALTTISETFRRPRLSLATFLLAMLALCLIIWVVYELRRPSPFQPSPAALNWYNKGTDALRNGAFLQASKAFEQALTTDAAFPLAHARLAEAYSELDYADKAKDELLRVQALVPDRSRLAVTDSLHLDAINATVTQDFPGAIKAYQELARHAPNDPAVYVDLGRAYEKNDEIKKAVESYVEATNRAPQYPTGFLRVAILYGRQGDQASALAAFDKADQLYQADGNFEGQAEVSYQRGYLFNQLGKISEARQHFNRSLEIANTTGNHYQQVKTLLKLGDVLVDAGEIETGRQHMRNAFELARTKGIDNYTKRALVDLGNTYIASGNYEEAEKHFKESLELSLRQKDARNTARALLMLASLAERRHNSDEAIRYFEQAVPFYQQGGYRKESNQAMQLLARAQMQKGEYDAARKKFEELLQLTQQAGDPSQLAIVNEDIGLLSIKQGRYPEALGRFDESYKIAKSLGLQKTVCWNLIHRANGCWRLGRFAEAHTALSEAAAIAEGASAAKNLAAAYYLAKARLAFGEGRWQDAESNSKQALILAGTQYKEMTIPALYTLGRARVRSGATREGRSMCEEALTTARDTRDPYLISEALIAFADALVQGGDFDRLNKELEALESVARYGNHDYEWLVLAFFARASRQAGERKKALDYTVKANSVLSSLKQEWGDDNYNSYLNRSDVQISRKQLSDLAAEKTLIPN